MCRRSVSDTHQPKMLTFCGLFPFLQHEFHRGSRNTRSLVKYILDSLEVNLYDLWEGKTPFLKALLYLRLWDEVEEALL